jgi:hypothetical protein
MMRISLTAQATYFILNGDISNWLNIKSAYAVVDKIVFGKIILNVEVLRWTLESWTCSQIFLYNCQLQVLKFFDTVQEIRQNIYIYFLRFKEDSFFFSNERHIKYWFQFLDSFI